MVENWRDGQPTVVQQSSSASADVWADAIEIESGGKLQMEGGEVRVDRDLVARSGSLISGHGSINFLAQDSEELPAVLDLQGNLQPTGGFLRVFTHQDSRVNVGEVHIDARSGSLVFDAQMQGPFAGVISIGEGRFLDFGRRTFFEGATVNLQGGNESTPAYLRGVDNEIRSRVNVDGNAIMAGRSVFS